jgi:hypothetical protein
MGPLAQRLEQSTHGKEAMEAQLKETFGTCTFARTQPPTNTPEVLNIQVTFEEALKLHLAIGECLSSLNKVNRSTRAGKKTALNLAVHLTKKRITVLRRNLVTE